MSSSIISYHSTAQDAFHRDTSLKRAHALKLAGDFPAAAALLEGLSATHPNDPAVIKESARLSFARQNLDQARALFHQVLQLTPQDADAHHWLANIAHLMGDTQAEQAHYRQTIALNPLLRVPAAKAVPDFSVLFLFAPGGANTPPDTLISHADYECQFLLLVPDATYGIEALRSRAQLVVNLISDVDQGRPVLSRAADLADHLALPVVNHPRDILRTSRESVAARLSGIAACRVPSVHRVSRDALAHGVTWPLLARVIGTHGGIDFEKLNGPAESQDFLARHTQAEFYRTDYIEYRAPDGFYRKYRFFFVGDAILPYHLAIDHQWKVHHATTDMANQPWMQQEEADFLQNPAHVFTPRHFAALHEIRQAIGLDFCGLDCAIGQDGDLIVFEANATMLVHHNAGAFPYKAPAVHRIKRAFDALLARRAISPAAMRYN